MTPGAREARCRRRLAGLGLALRKSRVRVPHLDDYGGYRVIDLNLNSVVLGSRFELDLEDVEGYLDES